MKIKILVFEDSSTKMQSFEEFLELRLRHELESDLKIVQRSDDSMLYSDLMTDDFHMILIDDDLGNDNWGHEIIDKIIQIVDDTPEVVNISMIYYSAGTPIDELKKKIQHRGNIPCTTFENLVDTVFERIKSRYFSSNT